MTEYESLVILIPENNNTQKALIGPFHLFSSLRKSDEKGFSNGCNFITTPSIAFKLSEIHLSKLYHNFINIHADICSYCQRYGVAKIKISACWAPGEGGG